MTLIHLLILLLFIFKHLHPNYPSTPLTLLVFFLFLTIMISLHHFLIYTTIHLDHFLLFLKPLIILAYLKNLYNHLLLRLLAIEFSQYHFYQLNQTSFHMVNRHQLHLIVFSHQQLMLYFRQLYLDEPFPCIYQSLVQVGPLVNLLQLSNGFYNLLPSFSTLSASASLFWLAYL